MVGMQVQKKGRDASLVEIGEGMDKGSKFVLNKLETELGEVST